MNVTIQVYLAYCLCYRDIDRFGSQKTIISGHNLLKQKLYISYE
jgi:hypothetical protein